MSIIITGLEMPTKDEEIIIRIDSSGTVMTEYALPISGTKALIVPAHGRLGDLDALIAVLERQINNHEKQAKMADEKGTGYTNDMYICDRNRDVISLLKAAPTIIPAEED